MQTLDKIASYFFFIARDLTQGTPYVYMDTHTHKRYKYIHIYVMKIMCVYLCMHTRYRVWKSPTGDITYE